MKINFIKNKKIIIGIIAAIVFTATTIPLLFTPQEEELSVRQREYKAKKDNITVGIETSGVINTLPNLHTFAEKTVIADIFVKLGSEVKKGDAIASISKENIEALIKAAKDELSDAKAQLLQASSAKDVLIKQNDKGKQDGLTRVAQDYDMKLSQRDSEQTRLQNAIRDYEEKISQLEKQITDLGALVKAREKQIDTIKERMNANTIKIGELNEKLLKVGDGSNERKYLNAALTDVQFEIQRTTSLIAEKTALAMQNESAIQVLNTQIADFKSQITDFENLLSSATTDEEKANLNRQIQRLREQIISKTAAIEELSHKNEITNLKNKLSNDQLSQKNLQNSLSFISDGSEESKAIRLETTKLQNQNTTWQQEIDKLLENTNRSELEKLKAEKGATETTLEKSYNDFSLKLEEIQRIELQSSQSLESQKKDNTFSDYKVNEEVKAINETISKANRNAQYAREALDGLLELQKNPVLYAQMDGVITALNYKIGDTVMTGKPVCTIGELSEITLTLPVSAVDIGTVEIGQKVNVYIAAFAEEKFIGRVSERFLVANDNGDYPVTITIDPRDQVVLPGMKAFATIILKEKQDILTLSNKAILLENGDQYVNIKNENGDLTKIKIMTGFSDGRVSEILSGLSENDIVVVEE